MRAHGARRTHDESLEADHVAVGVEQDAVGHLPVPARAPRLLVVALHRLGQTGVDHVAHVRLVDAHAKGYGGTDDLPTRYCSVIWLALYVQRSSEHNTRVLDYQPIGDEPKCLQCSNCTHPWIRYLSHTQTILTPSVFIEYLIKHDDLRVGAMRYELDRRYWMQTKCTVPLCS